MGTNQSRRNKKMDARKQYIREAYHAGSWYQADSAQLNSTLTEYLSIAQTASCSAAPQGMPLGIIAPHAGFRFSGPTAAYAYVALSEAMQKSWSGTVIVMHPSHHVYLDGCAISGATTIETPLGNIPVDEALRSELLGTGEFTIMSKETDQKEHSGEMQYPFIQKALLDSIESNNNSNSDGEEGASASAQSPSLRILPIMIGAITTSQEQQFGKLLAPFLARENVFAVISSDFCHWGRRFGYAPTSPPDHIQAPNSVKDIHEYVSFNLCWTPFQFVKLSI
jgi:predicted class III extradiol MEMO1 family dioxygenase